MIVKYIKEDPSDFPANKTIYDCIDQAVRLGLTTIEEANMQKLIIAGSEFYEFIGTVDDCLDKLSIVLQRAYDAIDKYILKEVK